MSVPMTLEKGELPLEGKSKEGPVAQLVEHRIENPCVGGSSPPGTTISNQNKLKLLLK